MIQLNVSLPAFHTISYVGSLTTSLILHFHPIANIVEELSVNESIVIKHTTVTFQRNIAIDANNEKLSISFNVRKFFGATDFCGYGGIRMFNQLNASVTFHDQHGFLQAHVPYDDRKHNLNDKSLKKSKYDPICANDSFIFKRKFYLDFGKTYIVFYDFNSMWNIDVTLNVHSSKYNAIFNFQHTYCNQPVQVYIFNDFFINCKLILIKLTRQVPIILQWPRNTRYAGGKEQQHLECLWPGSMDLTINHSYRYLRIFDDGKQMCTPNNILHITTASNTTELLLGRNIQNHSVPNVESLIVTRSSNICPFMEQSSYSIILTPSSGDVRCQSSRIAFMASNNSARAKNERVISDACVSLDVTIKQGTNLIYFMEPFFNILLQDKWVYYSLVISKECYDNSVMKVYFQTKLAQTSRMVHFVFAYHKYHYIWYSFGIMGVLMFHLERTSLECSAYIELTSSPPKQDIQYSSRSYFKVSTNF